ncbi:MAG: 3-oxoadipate enol-lactonase 2 [Candidatus Marinimicrobia bacterium]|nr:3-oxoadipate enol-lactonase 2 [Candidatus Neomarinimicrobiota bacterium]
MPFIELKDYRLHFRQYGSGPAIVFLHGLSFDSRMWEPQYEFFQKEYMTIGLDFRGHGFSDAPDIRYSIDIYIADVSALLNALHVHSAIIVGLSMGGAVAVEFTLQFPQRVSALVLASSAVAGHTWSDSYAKVMEKIRQSENPDELSSNLRQYWLNDPMFKGIRSRIEYARLLRDMATQFSGKPLLNHGDDFDHATPDISRLQDIASPACVLHGGEDRRDFRLIARKLATNISRVEWHQIEGVRHMINLEAPKRFNGVLQQFLYRVDAGGI